MIQIALVLLLAPTQCDSSKPQRVYGQQVLAILDDVKRRAGIKEPVELYAGPDNPCHEYNGVSKNKKGQLRISLHRSVFKDWPKDALQGIFTHELGHVLAGHSRVWNHVGEQEQGYQQDQANAWAIGLVGSYNVWAFLIAQGWEPIDAELAVARAEKLRPQKPN